LDHGDANDKFNHGTEDGEHGSSANDGTYCSWKLNMIWKALQHQKKPRVVWLVELHQQFVNVVNSLGIESKKPSYSEY